MAIIKKKITEFPICQSFIGLWTLGVDSANNSVRVSLEFIKTAYDNVVLATTNAINATSYANAAGDRANTATTNANNAAATANTASENTNAAISEAEETIARLEELEEQLVAEAKVTPTSMTLQYPVKVTLGNKVRQRIKAVLNPGNYSDCLLFLGSNTALSVEPDGSFIPTSIGIERVHVIPTESTKLYQTATIQVTAPTMRKATASQIRLTTNGIRLT